MRPLTPITAKPDMVDTLGTKWYLDKGASDYASRPDHMGTQLLNVVVWHIEELNGKRASVVVRYEKVIFESMNIVEIGVFIDKLKKLKREGHRVE